MVIVRGSTLLLLSAILFTGAATPIDLHLAPARAETPPTVVMPAQAGGCWDEQEDDGEAVDSFDAVLMRAILECGPELGLSDAQTQRLAAIADRFLRDTGDRQARLGTLQLTLMELMRPDPKNPAHPVDLAAAERVIRHIASLRVEQDLAFLHTLERLKAVLTPTQRSALAALLAAPIPSATL